MASAVCASGDHAGDVDGSSGVRGVVVKAERRRTDAFHAGAGVDDENDRQIEFFGDRLPGGDAGDVIAESIERIENGDWDGAATLLRENFAEKSICAQEKPRYEIEPVYGDSRHFSACHLNREGYAYPPDQPAVTRSDAQADD